MLLTARSAASPTTPEFLLRLADEGPPLPGWGDLTTLLRSLCDGGRLTDAEGGLLQLTPLVRELLDLPDAAQLGFVRRFPALVGHHWPPCSPRRHVRRPTAGPRPLPAGP